MEFNQSVFIFPQTSLASRSCPSCRWSTFSKPANSIDLHGSRWSSRSLSLSKSPSKSYRGNLLRKSIAALLIHSVASRTQSSDDKSFGGNYVGEEAGRLFSGPQSLLRLFKDCKCITLYVEAFLRDGFNTPAGSARPWVEYRFPSVSRVRREKVNLKTSMGQHIDFTLKPGCW